MKHSELRHQPRHVNPRIQDVRLKEFEPDVALTSSFSIIFSFDITSAADTGKVHIINKLIHIIIDNTFFIHISSQNNSDSHITYNQYFFLQQAYTALNKPESYKMELHKITMQLHFW